MKFEDIQGFSIGQQKYTIQSIFLDVANTQCDELGKPTLVVQKVISFQKNMSSQEWYCFSDKLIFKVSEGEIKHKFMEGDRSKPLNI